MSRKGKLPIAIPSGVDVTVKDGEISVKGPKGLLKQAIHSDVSIVVEEGTIKVSQSEKETAFQGLYRALLENMVIGTTKGFEKTLEMIGVGYRAAVKGKDLDLQVGYSHPTLLPIPEGLEIAVVKGTQITVSGCDRQKVGQFAATIRSKRPPEPYKGKGIRYKDEYVRKKAGKSASK